MNSKNFLCRFSADILYAMLSMRFFIGSMCQLALCGVVIVQYRGISATFSMKVLLVNKYHFPKGGADRAYLDMADILLRAGHEVAFFSMEDPRNIPTPWSRYFVSNASYDSSEKLSMVSRVRMASRIIWNQEARKQMERLIIDFRPNIAHVHNIYHQLSPSILFPLRRARVPIVMTLHDYKLISPNYSLFVRGKIWEETSRGNYWKCVRDRCVKDSYAKSLVCTAEALIHQYIGSYKSISTFLSPSRFLIEKFREFSFPFPIRHVYNPLVPFPAYRSGLPSRGAPFVYIGRLSSEKGLDGMLHALKKVDNSSKLHIVGEGPDRDHLKSLVSKLLLEKRVVFRGFLSGHDLERERREAKAILIPSLWYENMPYALTEALAEGSVVIASRMGGIPERVQDGKNGFLFDADDVMSLVGKMRCVQTLSDESFRDIQKSARESVFDLREEAFIRKLSECYQDLLPKK